MTKAYFTESSVQNSIKTEQYILRYRKHPLNKNFTTYEITKDEYFELLEIKKKYEIVSKYEAVIGKIKEILNLSGYPPQKL